ncbi:MAG: hypothetical protein JWO04_5418 [Gammaproteobacteria bacterium]|nr:hypothetical protein [Gammaproteobacteria bacterium]
MSEQELAKEGLSNVGRRGRGMIAAALPVRG